MKKSVPSVEHSAVRGNALSSRRRALALSSAVILAFAISVCVAPSAQMKSRAVIGLHSGASGSKVNSAPTEATVISGFSLGPQSQGTTFYFHGTGPNENPPTLLLNAAAPTATTTKFKDSASINRNNGNPWVVVGTWQAGAALTSGSLTSLSDLHVWLGLKNSDDQGTNFDLRVEAYKNSTLVTSGETRCITGITRNASSAKEVVLSLTSFSAVSFNGTSDILSLKVLTRVGTTPAGASCGGHANAVGLRLYFDAVSRSSRLSANIGAADTAAPVLTVTQPADGSITNQNSVNVAGTVSDSSPVTVTVNGTGVAVSNGAFSGQVSLNEGANQIRVLATDSSGNQSEIIRTVTRDTVSPVLGVSEPAQGATTKLVIVSGTVTDATAVNVTVNNIAFSVVDRIFTGQLTLAEGIHQIRIIATDAAGNQSEETRTVTVDTIAPVISDLSPPDGTVINLASATIQGRVTDTTTVTITVNDVLASVGAGGVFTATNIPIQEESNSIVIRAIDAAQNFSTALLLLTGSDRTPPAPPVVFPVISPTRLAFQTLEGRAEPGTRITITGGASAVTADAAFGTGLFVAEVNLATGANNLSVTSADSGGNSSPPVQVSITSDPGLAPPPAGQANQINIGTGNAQRGIVATELPRPLIAIVTDRDGNPVQGASVRFTIMNGGGQLIGGTTTVNAATDAQGHASARYISGAEPAIQIIRADFSGNTITPAVFTAEALKGFADGATNVTGIVLDQNLRALPNVLVRLGGQQTRTGTDGRFIITNAPSGPHQLLEVIGRDQVPLPGRWPNISYDIDLLPGTDNNIGRPLFLPKVNDGITMPLDSNNVITSDTTYDLPVVGGEPPIRVTARAGTRVTFPPDVTDKRLSVTRIATNRVPMVLEDGRATNLYISLQPAGAIFDPPLEVSFPNLDQLPANTQVLLMSFDHDAGRYIRVGTGRVSADGRSVGSEAGSGIRIGAWHGFPGNSPCPEVIILGHTQIAGNPTFEGKAIVRSEAWVEGVRAVPTSDPDLASSMSSLEYRASLSLPCARNVLVKMEGTTELLFASILPRYIDHDDSSNETDRPLLDFGTLYGGTERATSDILTLLISSQASLASRSFAWSVSGPGAGAYTPPSPGASARTWSVGEIKPVPGTLLFQVAIEMTDGRRFRLVRNIEIGIRTDDLIVVGWINPDEVPLSTAGVTPSILDALPPDGHVDSLKCVGYIGKLALNLDNIGPLGRSLTSDERTYTLHWMFKYAANNDPSTVIPGSNFLDPTNRFVSEPKVNEFYNVRENYKLFNRFQVKYRVRNNRMYGAPAVIRHRTQVGKTVDPCGISGSLPGQFGPAEHRISMDADHISLVNDGSPDTNGIRAFNTLSGKDVPAGNPIVFWENIGSQIRFSFAEGPRGSVIPQNYPTYYVYRNGKLDTSQIFRQTPTPKMHLYPNPYPFGTVPCTILGITTPGGRCGDATLPKEPGARTPPYIEP